MLENKILWKENLWIQSESLEQLNQLTEHLLQLTEHLLTKRRPLKHTEKHTLHPEPHILEHSTLADHTPFCTFITFHQLVIIKQVDITLIFIISNTSMVTDGTFTITPEITTLILQMPFTEPEEEEVLSVPLWDAAFASVSLPVSSAVSLVSAVVVDQARTSWKKLSKKSLSRKLLKKSITDQQWDTVDNNKWCNNQWDMVVNHKWCNNKCNQVMANNQWCRVNNQWCKVKWCKANNQWCKGNQSMDNSQWCNSNNNSDFQNEVTIKFSK